MNKKIPGFIFLLFIYSSHLFSQLECDMGFHKFLFDHKLYQELLQLDSICNEKEVNPEYVLLKGRTLLEMGDTTAALSAFQQIDSDSHLWHTVSVYTNGVNLNRDSMVSLINCPHDSLINEVLRLQHLASLIMQNNIQEFENKHQTNPCLFKAFSSYDLELFVYAQQLKFRKRKKRGLALAFSMIIPGLGKLYAGYPAESIFSFLPFAIMSAQALEAYVIAGLLSPQFIIFSTLSLVYYGGALVGSYTAVKRQQSENQIYVNWKIHNTLNRLYHNLP